MTILIILIYIIFCSASINLILKVEQEEAILIAFLGTFLLVYVLGIFNLLFISTWILLILLIFSMVFVICKLIKEKDRRKIIKRMLTLPAIIYYILLIGIYIFCQKLNFIYYDEFMFWGTNVKNMFIQNTLWANELIDGVHLVYPPYMGIIEYIFCKTNGNFDEGMCYFAIISTMLTLITVTLKNESYSVKSLIKIIITYIFSYIIIVLFMFDIANLSVDCILGITFAVSLYYTYTLKRKKEYVLWFILLIVLTLIKTNGILFSGILIMQLFLQKIIFLIKNRKDLKIKKILIKILPIITGAIIVILTYFSWNIYYTTNGKKIDDRHDKNNVDNISITELFKAIFYDEGENLNADNIVIYNNFKQALFEKRIIRKYNFNTTISILTIINIIYIINLIISKQKNKNIPYILSINIGFILYILSNLCLFMFVFIKYQGYTLMGFERYIQTYMIAMILSFLYIFLIKFNFKKNIITILILVLLSTGLNSIMLNPYERRIAFNEKTEEKAEYLTKNAKEDEKVFLIDQKEDYGQEFQKIRYLITPIKTNLLYEWNLGKEKNNIYYRLVITPKKLIEKLKNENYDYIYIIDVTQEFLADYQESIDKEAYKKLENNAISLDYGGNIISSTTKHGILLKLDKEQNLLKLAE